MNRIYLDLHVLQTVPPSCVNRDDTGSPKTAVYGGVTRARVSSQAWKHAMRLMFQEIFSEDEIGIRTKKVAALIAAELDKIGYEGDTQKAAKEALDMFELKLDNKKNDELKAMFFISREQAKCFADVISKRAKNKQPEAEKKANKKDAKRDNKEYETQLKEALNNSPSIDIALFGRMLASDPSLNYDACAQVAHSISTHEVRNEYDYFTAVDDIPNEDNAGASYIDTAEFNSSTLYRYATLNVRELDKQIKGDTAEAVKGFVKAFLYSMPTGKQNTFANRTVPDFVYITFRSDQPVNFAGAFEKPIYSKDGYVAKSIQALRDYALNTYKDFLESPQRAYCIGRSVSELGKEVSFAELLTVLGDDIDEYIREN